MTVALAAPSSFVPWLAKIVGAINSQRNTHISNCQKMALGAHFLALAKLQLVTLSNCN